MYFIKLRKHVDKIFSKLAKKNPKQLKIIQNKLEEIVNNPYIFKPLKKPLQGKRRVHIDKSFLLIYSIDEEDKEIILEDYDHHDNIYKK
jgi:YafQ family addiction module toxin component